jgi:hypothetical protein
MANNLIPNPTGLNAIVNKLQFQLYELANIWDADLDGYPICYAKEKDGFRTIEWFSNGIDYEALNSAEKNKFWFTNYYSVNAESINYYTTKLDLYFTVNLEQVKSSITTHRADQDARKDVLAILSTNPFVRVNEIITGIENVYRGYSYEPSDDMQPNHCFRIILDVLEYNDDLIIC